MANSCCFVQFPHPGREAGPRSGHVWSTLKANHARKFMQLRGEWIEADGTTGSGDLWAWGEWEPQSRLLRRLRQPDPLTYPACLWLPYYAIPDNSCEGLHNTDPFIFGDQMLYSNCRQPSSPRLRSLDRGSVIAFGSRKADQWLLDTVLVVADFVDYSPAWARSDLASMTPAAFLDVTGGPLQDNRRDATCTPAPKRPNHCGGRRASRDPDATLRLYRGATPTRPVHGMFSFFPAMPAGGDAGFARPGVELPEPYFNPKLPRSPKQSCGLTEQTMARLWESLAAQVHDAGLVLGTRAASPQRLRSMNLRHP